MQLGGSDDSSVLDSDEYPTDGLAHPKFAARADGVRRSAVCIVRGDDLLRIRPAANADRPRLGYELSLTRPATGRVSTGTPCHTWKPLRAVMTAGRSAREIAEEALHLVGWLDPA